MPDFFHLTTTAAVTTLTLSRPTHANALTLEFWREFPKTIRALDEAGATRALIIAAEGKNFCAGMDLSVFTHATALNADTPGSRASFHHTVRQMQDALAVLETARFPVIAAIQGACVGAGLELAAASDLRFATQDAYFKIAEIDIAMMADLGALQRLPKLLPDAIVKHLAYTGATLAAPRAEQLGFLIATTENPTSLQAAAQAAASAIAARSPLAIAGSKSSLLYARDHTVADALERAAWHQSAIWNPQAITTAITARTTKSPPDFPNLPPLQTL